MAFIVTADIHQTDLPRDSHRWRLFEFLIEQADKYKADIAICGDLTDAKDRHSARLTNDMALAFEAMAADHVVHIIPGNHDGIDLANPFFEFARMIEGVHFYMEPELVPLSIGKCLFLPHSKQPEKDWASLDFSKPDWIFCHQTFQGAVGENGFILPGLDPGIFGKTKAKVISGDIHAPQIVSKKPHIEYVGAPYRTRFGDAYEPRCLLIRDDGSMKDLHFETVNKLLVEMGADRKLNLKEAKPGDQVKVRVRLPRSAYPEWPAIRNEIVESCFALELDLTGPELIAIPDKPKKGSPEAKSGSPSAISPEEAMDAYAEKKGASAHLRRRGKVWLKEATGGK